MNQKSSLLIISLIGLVLISGCVTTDQTSKVFSLQNYLNNVKIKSEYTVKDIYKSSSPGGDRNWDLIYTIQNEEFVFCSGTYHFSGSGGEKTEYCSLEALKKNEYPFRIHLDLLTMSDILLGADYLPGIKSSDLSNSKKIKLEDRVCFYNIRNTQFDNILVCFDHENSIVNYAGRSVPATLYWNINGYDFTEQITNLI